MSLLPILPETIAYIHFPSSHINIYSAQVGDAVSFFCYIVAIFWVCIGGFLATFRESIPIRRVYLSSLLLFTRMGGGHGGHVEGKYPGYPTNVWSLTGGWFCRPKHWRRNTAIALAGIFLVCIPIAVKSAELEQRPHYPVHPIPSQKWCKNFPEPDPK